MDSGSQDVNRVKSHDERLGDAIEEIDIRRRDIRESGDMNFGVRFAKLSPTGNGVLPREGTRCPRCPRRSGTADVLGRHVVTVHHVAHLFDVSPVKLAEALKARATLSGEYVEKKKRRRKRVGPRPSVEVRLDRARKRLEDWKSAREKAETHVKKWNRKVRSLERSLAKKEEVSE